jgi:hypothetical protein
VSSAALATNTGRGAISASSSCWSTGSSSSRPAYEANAGQNQCGNEVVIASTDSPTSRRDSAAPPQPEQFDTAIANRESCAAAHSATLPSRECPITATRDASTRGSATSRSSNKLSARAHWPSAPHSSSARGRPSSASGRTSV